MTRSQQLEIFDNTTKELRELLIKKGEDYNREDVLGIFKEIATMVNISSEKVLHVMIALKLKRIVNLEGKQNNFESANDSLKDLINYAFLLDMMREEINVKDYNYCSINVSE